jgi:hypothetical protein
MLNQVRSEGCHAWCVRVSQRGGDNVSQVGPALGGRVISPGHLLPKAAHHTAFTAMGRGWQGLRPGIQAPGQAQAVLLGGWSVRVVSLGQWVDEEWGSIVGSGAVNGSLPSVVSVRARR